MNNEGDYSYKWQVCYADNIKFFITEKEKVALLASRVKKESYCDFGDFVLATDFKTMYLHWDIEYKKRLYGESI